MRQLTLLSSAVLVGLFAIIMVESSSALSTSGVFRLTDNNNAFLKPVAHTKRKSPVLSSGVRKDRPWNIDNSLKRRSRRTRSEDQMALESAAHAGINHNDFQNYSAEEEPEIVGFLSGSSEEWQGEVLQTRPTRPFLQNSSPERSPNILLDRGVKGSDKEVTIRYMQPRISGDISAPYNHEELDEVAPQNHVRLFYDVPQSYSPYSGLARYFMQYRQSDEASENYLPFFRFAPSAPSVPPQVEKETTTFDSTYNPVPVSYGKRGTHREYGDHLQGGMPMSGQLADFLPPIRTEAGLQGRSKEMKLGSAGSNEQSMKSTPELEVYSSRKAVANFGMEDVGHAEDSVEDQDSVEMEEQSSIPAISWYPVLSAA